MLSASTHEKYNHLHETTFEALKTLKGSLALGCQILPSGTLKLQLATGANTPSNLVDQGSHKQVFKLDDGNILLTRNCFRSVSSKSDAKRWCEIVVEEIAMANFLKELNLHTQQFKFVMANVCEYMLPVIIAPSFAALLEKGVQIRDFKNIKYGSTLIFGTRDNLHNPHYLQLLITDIRQDIVTLLANQVRLTSDSFNITIVDTDQTPKYEPKKNELILKRRQRLRLYFYDFSDPLKLLNYKPLSLVEKGTINSDKLTAWANDYYDYAGNGLMNAITKEEAIHLGLNQEAIAKIINLQLDDLKSSTVENIVKQVKSSPIIYNDTKKPKVDYDCLLKYITSNTLHNHNATLFRKELVTNRDDVTSFLPPFCSFIPGS